LRVVVATSLLTVVIATGAVLANTLYERAGQSARTALAARTEGIATQRALTHYWREREAMNEYLVLRRPYLLREVASQAMDFEQALGQSFVSSQHEGALLSEVKTANDQLIARFRSEPAADQSRAASGDLVLQLDRQAALVVGPLQALLTSQAQETRAAEADWSKGRAQARLFAVADALLFLGAIVFLSISAVRLSWRLARQNRELTMLDTLKNDFVASVSHELRTPLTSIRGYVEFVLEGDTGPLNEEQHRYLSIVDKNSERLLRLVGDLLFIAELDATSLQLESAPLSLTSLAEEAVDAARPAAAAKGLALRISAEELPESTGDGARLGQLLDNLISNAIKFTPAGEVTVSLRARGGTAIIEVADSGIGIPAAEQQRLFERFYRTSAATRQAIQGTGLGLSIAKAIAEGHGGTIECESVQDVGTTFRVRLPLNQPDPRAAPHFIVTTRAA
jgi:signal transduction histidine kinase